VGRGAKKKNNIKKISTPTPTKIAPHLKKNNKMLKKFTPPKN
jgi:hypothetical protein